MKSLIEYINEMQKSDIDFVIDAYNKGDGAKAFQAVVKCVDSNEYEKIEIHDIDNIETGCFIGYMPKERGWNTSRTAIRNDKNWDIIETRDSDVYYTALRGNGRGNVFGDIWQVVYVEHVPDGLDEIFEKYKKLAKR